MGHFSSVAWPDPTWKKGLAKLATQDYHIGILRQSSCKKWATFFHVYLPLGHFQHWRSHFRSRYQPYHTVESVCVCVWCVLCVHMKKQNSSSGSCGVYQYPCNTLLYTNSYLYVEQTIPQLHRNLSTRALHFALCTNLVTKGLFNYVVYGIFFTYVLVSDKNGDFEGLKRTWGTSVTPIYCWL